MGAYDKVKINKAIINTNFICDRKKYVMVKLDKSDYAKAVNAMAGIGDEYIEIIKDINEVSLMVEQKTWEERLAGKFKHFGLLSNMAIFTCWVTEENPTGYYIPIVTKLAVNEVGMYIQGAYTVDHIMIAYKDIDKALFLLSELKKTVVKK